MFRRECALLIFCLSAATATSDFSDPLQEYPKCCNETETIVLPSQNASATCIDLQSVPRASLVFRSNKTRHFSFLECSDDDLCVDVTENGRMVKVSCNGTFEEIVPKKKFIKCCPLKHSYDPQLHTCVKDARRRFALSSCEFLRGNRTRKLRL